MFDHHVCAGTNLDRIRAQHIDHNFEIARIANFNQWGSRLDDRFALLGNLEYNAWNWCADIPSVRRRTGAVLVPGEQCPCLVDLMFRGVMQEVRCPQVAIGNPHGQFSPLKRLDGRCSAFHQRACAIKFSFCLVGLRLRPLGGYLSAIQCRSGAAQPLLRLPPAARIEKRHRRRRDRRDNVINANPVANLEPYPGQPPGEWRRHHISLTDPRLAVLVNARDKKPFGHRCRLDRNGPRHHGPDNPATAAIRPRRRPRGRS